MLDIGKFAKPLIHSAENKTVIRFGLKTKEEIASALRELAEKVEHGQIIVQNVQSGAVATINDYFMQAIFIEFAEVETLNDLAGGREIKSPTLGEETGFGDINSTKEVQG